MQVKRRTSIFCAALLTDPALMGDICDNSLSVGDIYVHDKETRPLYVKFTMSFLMSSVFLGLKNPLSNKINSLHAAIGCPDQGEQVHRCVQGGILLLAVTASFGLRMAKEIEGNVCHYVFFCKYV